MKLRELAELKGNDLWKAIRGIRKLEHLLWLEDHFAGDHAKAEFIRERKAEIRSALPLAAQVTLSLDAVVAHATGCTPREANRALNALQEMAAARRREEGLE